MQEVWPKEEMSTHKLAHLLEKEVCCVYAGFDPTAPSLHIGNLLILLGLLHFQRAGHKVVALIGGATARIGDPSGKNAEREEMGEDQLTNNLVGIREDIERIFENHEKYFWDEKRQGVLQDLEVVNNESWYETMNIVQFLSKVGRSLRVSRMLARTSVKSRMESEAGISLTEFTYQAFQGYDWLHLYKTRGCRLQLGGSDQLGNMVAGQEMIGRQVDTEVWGVTLPLIVNEAGDKLGKSAGAPVWLNEEKTSPFDFYQFFMRLSDSEAERMLVQLTFLSEREVEELVIRHREDPGKRLAQEKLASSLTLLVHGMSGLDLACKTTRVLYGGDLDTLSNLSLEEARQVFRGADYLQKLFQPGLCLMDFAVKLGCFRTDRDAERIIRAGGFYINTVRCANTEEVLVPGKHVTSNGLTVVRVGKKNYYIVEWT